MDFGKRLKESRVKRGLSQEELAYQVNQKTNGSIKRNTISNYENDVSHPDYDTLRALGEILEISIDNLLNLRPEDYKSIAAESMAVYGTNKTLANAEKRVAKISDAAESVADKEGLSELLNESVKLNKELIDHAKNLYIKNKQAIEFINKGLDIE
ncbi:MAG: helix-turn-helix domain-containing protein [Bacteroidota bacterium]